MSKTRERVLRLRLTPAQRVFVGQVLGQVGTTWRVNDLLAVGFGFDSWAALRSFSEQRSDWPEKVDLVRSEAHRLLLLVEIISMTFSLGVLPDWAAISGHSPIETLELVDQVRTAVLRAPVVRA